MEFNEYKIGDIGTIFSGGTPSTSKSEYWGGNIPWLSSGETRNTYIENTEKTITEKGVKNSSTRLAKKNSIVIASAGQGFTRGQASLTKINTYVNQSVIVIEPNTNLVEPLFLLYNLKLRYNELRQISDGASIRGSLTTKIIKNLDIRLPSIEIQKQISSFINYIDSLILVNKKINQNLFKLAKYVYKEFYRDKVEKYDVKQYVTLDDTTSKFATGLNPRKNFVLGEGNNYYVTIKNMANNSIILDEKCSSITDEALVKINKRSDLKVGDLLFSGIGTIGRVHLIDKEPSNWNISESVFTLRHNDLISSEFLFIHLLSKEVQEYAKSLASGSVQKGIRMRDLKNFEFILHSEEDKKIIDSLLKPIISSIKSNEEEIQNLTKLRDTLLPKLMSGEIDVSEVEI